MRYAFAGDRNIAVKILKFLTDKSYFPKALFVPEENKASHKNKLIELSNLDDKYIFRGKEFAKKENVELLKELNLDYIFGIHFQYIIPEKVLNIPKVGFLNLHPGYLPYNKGWHTPSWAILEKNPYGATLHFMEKEIDKGDLINKKTIKIQDYDTANSLYQKVMLLEEEVFKESFEEIISLNPTRIKQTNIGTSHNKSDLKSIQRLSLDENVNALELIDKLRALTTNDITEGAYYFKNNKKYFIQIKIKEL